MVRRASHVCVLASIMIAGVAGAQVEGRPKVVTKDYDHVTPGKLISVYTRSYLGAGFTLKERKQTVMDVGTQNYMHLVFEITNPQHPRKKKGIVSFVIVWRRGLKRCAPCTVHGETFGGLADSPEYDEKEYGDFIVVIEKAHRQARAAIAAALDKSPAGLKSPGVRRDALRAEARARREESNAEDTGRVQEHAQDQVLRARSL